MTLFTFVIFTLLAFAVLTGVIMAYLRWVANRVLTDRFRDAESIVNGQVPERWISQINRRLNRRRFSHPCQSPVSGTQLVLEKLDQLQGFFENSPFFETAEARQLLLTQLQERRRHWAALSWEALLTEHTTSQVTRLPDR